MNKSYLGSQSVQWLMKETDSKVTGAFFLIRSTPAYMYVSLAQKCPMGEILQLTIILKN